jgi:NAD(P)-dependent dehydrogenase (short-subunit alcohol dehydrogenase family)
MTALNNQTVWLIGASSGIGEALIGPLLAEGARLIISARDRERLQALADVHPGSPLRVVPVDVTDASVIDAALAEIGTVPDVVMLLAGDYSPMSPDEFDQRLFARLIDVNFLGAVRVMEKVLPAMRVRGHGDIFITASLSGVVGLPGAAPYSAGKAALINLAESMQPVLKQDGVALRVINPGFVRTRLTEKNRFNMPFLLDAETAATSIIEGVKRDKFDIRFPWQMSFLIRLLSFLPYRLFFAITRRMVPS